jgi:hypothetical protein
MSLAYSVYRNSYNTIIHITAFYLLIPTWWTCLKDSISPVHILLGALVSIGSLGLYNVETPRVSRQSAHEGGEVFSLKHTDRLYLPGIFLCTDFSWRLIWLHDHRAAGMINLKKNPNDPFGNPTRELPACNSVPQQTAPPCTQFGTVWYFHSKQFIRNPSRLKKHSSIWEMGCFFLRLRNYGLVFIVLCSYAYVFECVRVTAKRHHEV